MSYTDEEVEEGASGCFAAIILFFLALLFIVFFTALFRCIL